MDYENLALNMLSKATSEEIALIDVGTESYGFEVEELDPGIIPNEYQEILTSHKEVMTHTYGYKSTIVYIIVPLGRRDDEEVLVGVLEEGKLIDYVLVK